MNDDTSSKADRGYTNLSAGAGVFTSAASTRVVNRLTSYAGPRSHVDPTGGEVNLGSDGADGGTKSG
jgi:hypothetical protein